jgi:hypothetical protein
MKYVVAFGRFWWDFIVGDDWRIAAGVVAALAIGAVLVARTGLSDTAVSLVTGACIFAAVAVTILGAALAAARKET